MKLSDFLQEVGKPVAYYPSLARVLGGVKEAVFMCQFVYWLGKQKDEEGWIYKEISEIEVETGLTAKEQRTVRRKLGKLGVLEEQRDRLKHRIYYLVKLQALNALWEQSRDQESDNPVEPSAFPSPLNRPADDSPSDQREFPQSPIGQFGKVPSGTSYKEIESTTQSTTERKNGAADAAGSRSASSAKSRKKRQTATRDLESDALAMAIINACVLDVAALNARKREDVWATCVYLRHRYEGEKADDEIIVLVEEFRGWLEDDWKDKTPSPTMVREWWERFTVESEAQADAYKPSSEADIPEYQKKMLADLERKRAAEQRAEEGTGAVN